MSLVPWPSWLSLQWDSEHRVGAREVLEPVGFGGGCRSLALSVQESYSVTQAVPGGHRLSKPDGVALMLKHS